MEIRSCKPRDFKGFSRLLKEFHEESLHEYGVSFEEEVVMESIREHFKEVLILLVDDEVVGVIGGKLIDYPLQEQKIFQEMVWFVSKKYRRHGLKLLKALEDRCRERGIKIIIMVANGQKMKDKLNRFYNRMGYNELETLYIKVVE